MSQKCPCLNVHTCACFHTKLPSIPYQLATVCPDTHQVSSSWLPNSKEGQATVLQGNDLSVLITAWVVFSLTRSEVVKCPTEAQAGKASYSTQFNPGLGLGYFTCGKSRGCLEWKKTSQELRMLSSVTINCQVRMIVWIQVLNCQNCNQCLKCPVSRTVFPIVKNCQNCQNCPKL